MARVLITGCSSGIGRVVAQFLSQRGDSVIATARRVEALADLDVNLRLALDVTDPRSIADAVAGAGVVDVLINNAGVSTWGPIELGSEVDLERVLQTNLMGALRMTRAVLPQMRQRRSGRIIQISSTAARHPLPLLGIYAASKAAVETLSMSLRLEMRQFGVQICVVGMGPVDTQVDRNRREISAAGTEYECLADRIVASMRASRGRAYPPIEVARVIASVIDAERPAFRTYVGEGLAERIGEVVHWTDDLYEAHVLEGKWPWA
jgi:short-subunit dehydrogenase